MMVVMRSRSSKAIMQVEPISSSSSSLEEAGLRGERVGNFSLV